MSDAVSDAPRATAGGPARVLLGASLGAALVAAFVARVPLQGMPHVSDELAYTWQARLFAAGMRVGPEPELPQLWTYPFWMAEGGGYSPFPPGWPLLLAAGEALGAGWLVNPLLFGLLPGLIYLLTLRWTGEEAVARAAAVVAALSPGAWLLAASRMSQTSVLVALALAAVCVTWPRGGQALGRLRIDPEGRHLNRVLLAHLAGLAVAYVVLARQLDALLVGGPLLLCGLWRHRALAAWAGLVGPPALATLLLLADNAALTGDPLRFPMTDFFAAWPGSDGRPGCNRLGFGEDVGCHPTLGSYGHTPEKAWIIGRASLERLDVLLLGLPGSLLLALAGAWRLRRRLAPAVVLGLLVVGGYALYWSQGAAYGARFYHPLYLVLPGLVAAGAVPLLRRWALPVLALVCLGAGSRFLPDLAHEYWCVDAGLVRQLEAAGVEEGVVFLRIPEGGHDAAWPSMKIDAMECSGVLEATEGFVLNDPSRPTGGLQVRHALPDERQATIYMSRAHPGQPAWLAVLDPVAGTWTLVSLGVLAP